MMLQNGNVVNLQKKWMTAFNHSGFVISTVLFKFDSLTTARLSFDTIHDTRVIAVHK